jgi:transmembrane sensor
MSHEEFSSVEIEASEWLVTMSDRSVSLEDRARFETWLAASPQHERVYRAQKSAWSAVAHMPHLLEDAGRRSAVRRPVVVAVAASLALVAVTAVILFHAGYGAIRYATQVAQIKDVRLDDGTVVTLGASSGIRVAFTESRRHVTLTGGEAFFEVARDTARPFIVNAGDTQVQVLGTQFDVHYGANAVRVAVLEGRVRVEHAAAPRVLTAGEAVVAPKAERIAAVTHVDERDVGAWRSGRLVYVDARLRDVVADVNRYYDGKIELADDRAGDMQLTAAFRADQIDRMLEILISALPLEARRSDGERIVLASRQL